MKEKPYKFVVRLPTTMRDLIAESAQHYRRSMNSDIVARLHHSFSGIPDDASERGLAP
ncbi:MAG: Arc family DNA-binding protein, partial [Pseudomonadales bacterium]